MPRNCKVLLSVYACNPTKGSEPGIGWNWVVEISKLGYSVYVLTRTKHRNDIKDYIKNRPELNSINFIYHDLSINVLKLKGFIGVYLYYEIWQLTAYQKVKAIHEKEQFSFVHHITFGSFRQPSFLHKLNIPFYFGSVGGGEYAPKKLLNQLPLKYRIKEKIRSFSNVISLSRNSLKNCLSSSDIIFCKTEETLNILPIEYRSKAVLQHDIGQNVDFSISNKIKQLSKKKHINILYAGRLIYWKGAHLAIESFYHFNKAFPDSTLTLIGDGSFRKELIRLVISLDIASKVTFKGNVNHSLVSEFFKASDIFLFPTLHDSSGTVILESLNFGIPTVCLNTGGPLFLLTAECPTIVECQNLSQAEVINNLKNILIRLASDSEFYQKSSQWSFNRIKELTWSKSVTNAYKLIEDSLLKSNLET
ncbi:MAG: glycosyltransferase [Bacteroidota bacterium]|nr:glycosyltransferase [Bacteroidota bacterium]